MLSQKTATLCEYCASEVGPAWFRLSFEEIEPVDPKHLTDATPQGLMLAAENARQRAEELEIPQGVSDTERAFARAAAQTERGRLLGEAEALESERRRVEESLEYLHRAAENMEPHVFFGSGSLDFCGPGHAVAFLASRYQYAAVPAVESVKNANREGQEFEEPARP